MNDLGHLGLLILFHINDILPMQMANSVDPGDMFHFEKHYPDLHYLPIQIF